MLAATTPIVGFCCRLPYKATLSCLLAFLPAQTQSLQGGHLQHTERAAVPPTEPLAAELGLQPAPERLSLNLAGQLYLATGLKHTFVQQLSRSSLLPGS